MCQLPKLKVAGSNPVSRSKKIKDLATMVKSFFVGFEGFVSVFVSVWRKKHPEKVCVIPNIFETRIPQKAAPIRIAMFGIYFCPAGIGPEAWTGIISR